MDNLRKCAIFLLSIGEDAAAEVMKYLSPKEVQKLGQSMAELKAVSKTEVSDSLQFFSKKISSQFSIQQDQEQFLKSVLKKALGDDKADMIISKIISGADTTGIDALKWMDPTSISDLLKNEHPQIIATILAHLEAEQASSVLALFTERIRADVTLRLATLDGVQPVALEDLNTALTRLLSGQSTLQKQKIGGVKAAAEILNFLGSSVEGQIMETIHDANPELAQKILDEMFTFEDLENLDDRSFQILLREISTDTLVVALKGATPTIKDKVFKNMSQRAAEGLKEELELKGPTKLSEVESQQKEILKICKRLIDEGQITLAGKGGGEQMI